MKRLKSYLSLSLLMIAPCYGQRTDNSQVNKYTITNFSAILDYVNRLPTASMAADNLCLIYDMDNTLLTAEPNLGSDSWMVWNNNLALNDPNKIANWNISTDSHSFEGALRFFIKYYPTEKNTIPIINQIKDQLKHPSIVMTARSYERYYAATKNELEANHLDFMSNPIGSPATASSALTLVPNSHQTAYKAYFDGVYYSADDNKGTEILKLIKEQRKISANNELCQTTIFVDNSKTNIENVYNAFLFNNEKLNLIALHYTAYDNYLSPTQATKNLWDLNQANSNGQLLYQLINQLNLSKMPD